MAIVGEAHIVVRAITTGFQRDVENSLKDVNGSVKNIGQDIGKDFSKSVSKGMGGSGGKSPFGELSKEAEHARSSFNKLTKAGYFLAPAISGAVGAVGDLVFGLFSIGSAVGSALPALAVLPSILIAIGQAGAVAKLAFMGVGKAVGALTKQKTGGGGNAAVAQKKAIADANKALARAYQDAADQMYDADLKVARAQNELTLAFAKGKEEIQQLGFSAEEAALSEEKAGIQLERAREALRRVQDLPPNSRARREAEIAFKEADLNYRESKDKVNDLAKQQAYAAATGVEGTKAVINAQQNLNDATTDQARAQRDTAQRIADAQVNLAAALNKTSTAAAAVNSAMAGLPKSAQDFARHIANLKPKFDELRAAAADGLFPGLTKAVDNLVTNLFPHLQTIIGNTAGAIGTFTEKFSAMLTTKGNLKIIDQVFAKDNVKIIGNMGDVATSLADAMIKILGAVSPIAVEFSGWLKNIADNLDKFISFKSANGELATFFQNSIQPAKDIGTAVKDTFVAFFELGKGAETAGLKIIKAFDGAMIKLKDFAKAGNSDGMFSEGEKGASSLETKFNNIADNFITIGKFAGEFAKALFDVAGNPGITAFFEKIMGLPGTFATLANKINSVMGAKFGDFVNELGTLIGTFTDTGGMSLFFDILTNALKVVNILFSNPVIASAFALLAALKGIALALGVIGTVSGFTGKVLFSSLMFIPQLINGQIAPLGGLNKMWAALRQEVVMLTYTLGIGLGPILAIVTGIAALVAIIYLAYQKSEIFRTSIKTLVDAVGVALNDAMTTINDAIKQVMPSFTGISDIFKKIGDYIGTYLVPFFQVILVGAIDFLAGVISGFIKIVGGIIKAFSDPIAGVKIILSGFVDFFKSVFLTPLVNLLKVADIFGAIPNGLKAAINKMIRMWNNFELELKIPTNTATKFLGIAGQGFTIQTPDVRELAKGGVVRPTPGGTIARIAEAGRAERVEPLDANGLSERDKAMINLFMNNSGGTNAGNTFNVYPSQGMDEQELANLVSRKVAWNMRIGA